MERIKTILLCGFLGSGKTTLLSSLLQNSAFTDKKIAVLVNDFGTLPVDAALLPEGDFYVSKINKGSIFCLCTSADIIKVLDEIAKNIMPDYLFVEATGLAEPSDVSAMFRTDLLKERYNEVVSICLVDALNCCKLIAILPAIVSQLSIADIVVINKIDLVNENELEHLRKVVNEINSNVFLIETQYGEIAINDVLSKIHSFNPVNIEENGFLLKIQAPENMINFDFQTNNNLELVEFCDLLNKYRNQIIRAKGIGIFDDNKKFIDIVNGDIKMKNRNLSTLDSNFRNDVTFILRENTESKKFIDTLTYMT